MLQPTRLPLSLRFAMGALGLAAIALGAPFQDSAGPAKQGQESGADTVAQFLELDRSVGHLFFAVEVGDDARALQWIGRGLDLRVEFGGQRILDLAVQRKRLVVFNALIEAGLEPVLASGKRVNAADLKTVGEPISTSRIADQELQDWNHPYSALLEAASKGNLAQVTELLAGGGDANVLLSDGTSAVHVAAAGGHAAVLQLLIESGADLDRRGGASMRTPLEMALASRGNDTTVAALLAAGVKLVPDQQDPLGTTLLHLAAANGYLHTMRELIANAAVTNAKSYLTAEKNQIVDTPIFSAIKNDETDAVVILILRGAELDAKDYQGGTALWWAQGHTDGLTARRLISGGADPNLAGREGEAPLLEALRTGKEEKVRVLLEMGADPDALYQGKSGLHVVAMTGGWELATWLLDAGATRDLRDTEGRTALEVAVQAGNHMVAHVLVAAPLEALLLAVGAMDLDAMQQALQLGANPTQNLSDGSTPLHQFARLRGAGFEAASLFLAAGANPNALDAAGNSPLSELIEVGAYKPFIELLLTAGAEPRMGSQSASMLAQRLGDRDLMTLLNRRPGIAKVPVLTRSGFPHKAAQAAKACERYAGLADYPNALDQVDWAVQAKPMNGRYRLYRAKLRAATGDAAGSLADYAILLKNKPSWFDPKVDYGVLLVQNGHFAKGLTHLDEVLTRFVGSPDAKLHLHRGQARTAEGDIKGALEDLELANRTAPNRGDILRHLGIAQHVAGDLSSACASWASAVKAGDEEAAEWVAQHCK